jgi:3-hydroxy-9,10-secoandrosta-1,3,5(10)-triene-9,17-dione monooxygenase
MQSALSRACVIEPSRSIILQDVFMTTQMKVSHRHSKAFVPQPEPGLTSDVVIERAKAMIPMLREQQDAADDRGHFSDEVLGRFVRSGFYRILQPRMFGGYEFDLETFYSVVTHIATGHPSSGWCFCLSASHCALLASHWSEQAQVDLFGADGEFRSPHRAVPGGVAKPAPGGYEISGTWAYSSGIPVSTHFAGNTMVSVDGGPPRVLTFFLDKTKVTVLDDWGKDSGLGMQGSGSNSVVIDSVFVPEHHTAWGDHLFGTTIDFEKGTPGTSLHGNPLYLGIFGAIYHLCFTSIAIGAARAAMDEFSQIIAVTKVFADPSRVMQEDPDTRRVMGQAAMLTDAAQACREAAVRKINSLHERWESDRKPVTAQETMQVWALGRKGAQMACDAVQLLFQHSMPRAANKGSKLQRYWRDVQMYLIHPSSQPWVDQAVGEAALGLEISKYAHRR